MPSTVPTIPEIMNPLTPEDFVLSLFVEILGLYQHRNRYLTNPDEAIKERALVHFNAKIHQTLWIVGEYTGWGELRARDEYEVWAASA